MFRVLIASVVLSICSSSFGMTRNVNSSDVLDNRYMAFVVLVRSESSLNQLPHSRCLGIYRDKEVVEKIGGIRLMSDDMGKKVIRPIDDLKESYFSIDPIHDNGAFLQKLQEYLTNNGQDRSDDALNILRQIAQDALVTSQSAFVTYSYCNKIAMSVEIYYEQINNEIMNFFEDKR